MKINTWSSKNIYICNSLCLNQYILWANSSRCVLDLYAFCAYKHVNYSTGTIYTSTTLQAVKCIERLSPCVQQVNQDHTQPKRAGSPAGPAACPYCPQCWATPLEGHSSWACLDLCLTSGPSQSCGETAAPSGSRRRYFLVRPDRGSEITLEVANNKYKQDFENK